MIDQTTISQHPANNHKTKRLCNNNSPLSVQFNNVHVLQLLKNVTSNRATALAKMGWATAVPLAPSIDPTECTDTQATSQVDFPGHGSYIAKLKNNISIHWMSMQLNAQNIEKQRNCSNTSPDVVPIRIIWSKLLQCSSLHNISPRRKLNLSIIKNPKSNNFE